MQRDRDDAHAASRRKQGAWRTSSLCARVRQTLELAFGDLGDDRLDGLCVEDVVPAPNAGRLLVLLRRFDEEHEEDEILAALAGAEGLLRCEVAAAIHRKRTPELAFVILDGWR